MILFVVLIEVEVVEEEIQILTRVELEPECSREGQQISYLAPVNVANNSTNIIDLL